MAGTDAIRLFEAIYTRIDKQVRDIVTSMLPSVTVAAQDDGAVIANEHRILNFQGPGVAVSDDPAMRRVNIFVPGAPTTDSTTTVASSTSVKARSLWSGGGSVSYSYTADGSEGSGAGIGPGHPFPAFTGPFTISVGDSVVPSAIINTNVRFRHVSPGPVCWEWASSIHSGNQVDTTTRVVGDSGWSCTDWDQLHWFMAGATNNLQAGHTYTLTITAAGLGTAGNSAPPANWDQLSYSDSSWGSAVVAGMESGEVAPGSSSPVWATSAPASATEETLLRHTFSLPTGTIAAATLQLAANDALADGSTHINGRSIATPLASAGAIRSFSLSPSLLTPGAPNLLAFWGQNTTGTKSWVGWQLTVGYVAPGTDDQYIPWSTMTTKGDLIVGTGASTGVRHGVGTDGYVLTSRASSSDGVAWEAAAGGGGGGMTNPMTTQDDLIIGGSSGTPARLAKGSDGQVLTVDASTHHLVWTTPTGGYTPVVYTQTLSAAASSVIFSSIASSGRNIRWMIEARHDQASDVEIRFRLNSDSSAVYTNNWMFVQSTVMASAIVASTTSGFAGNLGLSADPTGVAGLLAGTLYNYTNTNWVKHVHSTTTTRSAGSLYGLKIWSQWLNTSAITSVTFFPTSGNFVAGSVFTLALEP